MCSYKAHHARCYIPALRPLRRCGTLFHPRLYISGCCADKYLCWSFDDDVYLRHQLVGKRTLQGLVEHVKGSKAVGAALVTLAGFLTVAVVLLKNEFLFKACEMADAEVPMDVIGTALVGSDKYQYVLPFEFISVFLLACIIGGIVVARKDKEDK